MSAEKWHEAVRLCKQLLFDRSGLDRDETGYKLQISDRIKALFEATQDGEDFVPLLKRAFAYPPNNLTSFYAHRAFIDWASEHQDEAREALLTLSDTDRSLEARVDGFLERVPGDKPKGPGSRLSLASYLLMGLDPAENPMYRTRDYRTTERLLGWPAVPEGASQGETYAHHRAFARQLLDELQSAGLNARNLLDAQSLIWILANDDSPTFASWRGEATTAEKEPWLQPLEHPPGIEAELQRILASGSAEDTREILRAIFRRAILFHQRTETEGFLGAQAKNPRAFSIMVGSLYACAVAEDGRLLYFLVDGDLGELGVHEVSLSASTDNELGWITVTLEPSELNGLLRDEEVWAAYERMLSKFATFPRAQSNHHNLGRMSVLTGERLGEARASIHDEWLSTAFAGFRQDPLARFHVKLRRKRAEEIRGLLSDPEAVDLGTFNRDVWVFLSSAYHDGEEISRDQLDTSDPEQIARLDEALDTGALELHGNYIWSPPTQIYAPMLELDDARRTEHVHEALRVLVDGNLDPLDKTQRIDSVFGFGPATSTALVMVFHPDQFAIYNKQSRGAMRKLGRDENTLEVFEWEAELLKDELGADDFLELDWFLYGINQGWYALHEPQPGTRPDVGPLNMILYGPPGTGKTYAVQREAVRILSPDADLSSDERVSDLYRDFRSEGLIEFVTFHPSYSYEEFVEGFRYDQDARIPVLRDGVFKLLVDRAISPRRSPTPTAEGTRIWKVSLGGSPDQYIFERCMREGEIAVGWFGDENLEERDSEGIADLFAKHGAGGSTNNINSVDYLVNGIRDGDYVAVLKNQREIRAIGVVTGPYRYREDYQGDYPHTRPTDWLLREDQDVYEMNDGTNLTQQTIYPLSKISLQDFVALLPEQEKSEEPHILIVDEINRGNISRIFGELITLLEEDKRRGAPNEMSVRLPYSQQNFAVPSNLHVIGTMNTADRSIALLDVALRRRFAFKEMMPDVKVVRERLLSAIEEGVETDYEREDAQLVCEAFEELNRRITVLLDRDHQIGHSYFMEATSTSKLHEVLYRRVFPLLQEYFYNDQRKLKLLLGVCEPNVPKGFVHSMEAEYRRIYGEDPLEDEAPWEFHEYTEEQLQEALRNTFPSRG